MSQQQQSGAVGTCRATGHTARTVIDSTVSSPGSLNQPPRAPPSFTRIYMGLKKVAIYHGFRTYVYTRDLQGAYNAPREPTEPPPWR